MSLKYNCGPVIEPVPKHHWCQVKVEGNGDLLVKSRGKKGFLPIAAAELNVFQDLPTAVGPCRNASPTEIKRNVEVLCHKGRIPVVLGDGGTLGGPASLFRLRRKEGPAVGPFWSAQSLHYHVLKHVLGLKEDDMFKAQKTYDKLYAPLLRPFLPTEDISEPTHEFWIGELAKGDCRSLALWKKNVPFDTIQRKDRPCGCSSDRVPECYASISYLVWAWWLFVIQKLPLGLRALHLHGTHEGEPAIVAWDRPIELRLTGENVAVVRTAFVPGPLEATDRSIHQRASFDELRKTGRYEQHAPWIRRNDQGPNGGNQ